VWKDTPYIPAGETVEILVDMSNPDGGCCIATSRALSAGMMRRLWWNDAVAR